MHTIEAAYLVPLAFVLSLYILFAGIVLYDRTAVDYALDGALIRGGENPELDNDELLRYVENEFRKLLEGRLIMADGTLDVTIAYDSISATYRGSVNLPALPAIAPSSAISTTIDRTGKVTRIRRSRICRAVSAIRNNM